MQIVPGVAGAGDNFTIHLDGNSLVGQLEPCEQVGHGRTAGNLFRLSVHYEIHA